MINPFNEKNVVKTDANTLLSDTFEKIDNELKERFDANFNYYLKKLFKKELIK